MVSYVGTHGGRRRLRLGRTAAFYMVVGGVLGGLAVVAAFGVAARSTGELMESRRWEKGAVAAAGDERALRVDGEAVRIPLSPSPQRQAETGRRWRAFVQAASVTPAEERRLKEVIGELHESWTSALAYFEMVEEPEPTAASAIGVLTADHAREIEGLVREATVARLRALLAKDRLALLDRQFQPLTSLVAAAPALY